MGYFFQLAARVLLYASQRQDNTTMAFVTPVMEHWLERETVQWVYQEGSIQHTHHTMSECSYHRPTSRSERLTQAKTAY